MSAAVSARRVRSIPAAVFVMAVLFTPPAVAGDTLTVGGLTLVNKGLVGVGRIPADQRDKFGETFGSGSGMAADLTTWKKTSDGYNGTFYLLPDRGYNVAGTTDYRARLYKHRSHSSPSPTRSESPTRSASAPWSRRLPTPFRSSTRPARR